VKKPASSSPVYLVEPSRRYLPWELATRSLSVALLRSAKSVGEGSEQDFEDHEYGHDPNGQADPTEGTKNFVAHVMSPCIERPIRPAVEMTAEGGRSDRTSRTGDSKRLGKASLSSGMENFTRP